MCHISREKSGTTPGEMKTISFQQIRSAPKMSPVVYKTYVILWAPLRHPAIEWQQSAMNLIAPESRERARAYYSVWHHICKFTHLFNIIFRDLRLEKSNIISAEVNNNFTEFIFSISQHFYIFQDVRRSGSRKQWTMVADVSIFTFRTVESPITRALSSSFSVGASLSGENLFNVLIGTEEQCFDSPNCPAARAHRNRTMYRTPWASHIQSRIYSPHILTILKFGCVSLVLKYSLSA